MQNCFYIIPLNTSFTLIIYKTDTIKNMKKILLLATTIFCFFNLTSAQPGKLDPTFGTNGIVTTDIGEKAEYSTSYVHQILPQPEGSMYVRQGVQLSKRLSNGSIDTTFGLKGHFANAGFEVNQAAVQSDGKIVVVGTVETRTDPFKAEFPSDYALARYNTDGTLDSSFSGDGKQTTDLSPNQSETKDGAYAVAIQKDGKIVVAGQSNNYLSLARYK